MATTFDDRLVEFVDANRDWLRKCIADYADERRQDLKATSIEWDAILPAGETWSSIGPEEYDRRQWEHRDELAKDTRQPPMPLPPPGAALAKLLTPLAKAVGLAAYHDALCQQNNAPPEYYVRPIPGVTAPRDPQAKYDMEQWHPWDWLVDRAIKGLREGEDWTGTLDDWLTEVADSIPRQGRAAGDTSSPPKPKRSTAKGEGRVKLIAALTTHHEYANDSCLNLEPIGNNKLAELACVSVSTASHFFKEEFQGHAIYRKICSDKGMLINSLKLLNQDYSPYILYGAKPPGEDDREDED